MVNFLFNAWEGQNSIAVIVTELGKIILFNATLLLYYGLTQWGFNYPMGIEFPTGMSIFIEMGLNRVYLCSGAIRLLLIIP